MDWIKRVILASRFRSSEGIQSGVLINTLLTFGCSNYKSNKNTDGGSSVFLRIDFDLNLLEQGIWPGLPRSPSLRIFPLLAQETTALPKSEDRLPPPWQSGPSPAHKVHKAHVAAP